MACSTVAVCIMLCLALSCTASMEYFSETATSSGIASQAMTNINDRPYMASMRMKPHWWKKALHCDAAILGDRWALTSARCCVRSCGTPYIPSQLSLRSDSTNMETGGFEHQIGIVTIKTSYTLNSMDNNMCLLEVKVGLGFGSSTKALRLAESEDYTAGVMGQISGWSRKGNTSSNELATMTLPLISNEQCKQFYEASGKSADDITERLMCVVTSGKDVCHGEGGSPLVIGGKLAGIVTAGSGCGNIPGVYTRISAEYRDWIKQHMGGDLV